MKCVLEKVVFRNRNPDIISAADDMCLCLYICNLEDRGFVVIPRCGLPGSSTEEIGVVKGGVVIAPVGNVFHSACTGHSSAKTSGLGNKPVRHVAAIAISTNRKAARICYPILHERVHSLENVFSGARHDLRHDA